MKLVINIDEGKYKWLKEHIPKADKNSIVGAVVYGVPLPKGHGRLIDADAFIAMMEDASKKQRYKELLIDDCLTVDVVFKAIIESLQNKGLVEGDAPTIIEADRSEEE